MLLCWKLRSKWWADGILAWTGNSWGSDFSKAASNVANLSRWCMEKCGFSPANGSPTSESRVLEIRELEVHLEPDEVDETKNWNQLESARIALPGNLMRTKFVRCTKRFEIERLEFLQLITRSKSSSGTCAQQEGEGLVVAICILTPFSTSPSCSLFSWSFQRWRFMETWWITKSP